MPRATADTVRTEEIARAWARATLLTGEARRVLGFLLAVTAVVVLVAGALFLFFQDSWTIDERLVTAGNAVLSASVLGLLWVGRQAYRNPAQRRTVGIVWDLGTFWPRAVHPLAPPCYAERAVPDLIGRMEYLTGTGNDGAGQDEGTVLLSCHSQGSVLGAVVLMQVGTATSARTAFLTYGCPLARLYGRFFPAYFSGTALDRLGRFLRDTDIDTEASMRPTTTAPPRQTPTSAPRGAGATCTGAATRSAGRCSSTVRRCGRRRAPTRTTSTGRCSTRSSHVPRATPARRRSADTRTTSPTRPSPGPRTPWRAAGFPAPSCPSRPPHREAPTARGTA